MERKPGGLHPHLRSLIERYKRDPRFVDRETDRQVCMARLTQLGEVANQVEWPNVVRGVILTGSYSNFDVNRPPRISGENPSDLDLLLKLKLKTIWDDEYERLINDVTDQIKNVAMCLQFTDLVECLISLEGFNVLEVLLPTHHAYVHQIKTGTLLVGNFRRFSLFKVGKHRDTGKLPRPTEDIAWENWVAMH